MKLFYTQNNEKLASSLGVPLGKRTLTTFNDGELLLTIDEDVSNQEVIVLAGTQAPGDNLIETFLLIDALVRVNAHILLIFTYFGYNRQDKPIHNQALAAQMLSNFFITFPVKQYYIVQPHNSYLNEYLIFDSIYPYDIYNSLIKEYQIDCIVAPDNGIKNLCKSVAQENNIELISFSKKRPSHDNVTMKLESKPVQKNNILIIDDIISTGNTLFQAVDQLESLQPKNIYAMITHTFLQEDALQKLKKSSLTKLFLTNTISSSEKLQSDRIEIISIADTLINLINTL